MIFNEHQKEGLAKVADNLATASMISAIVGGLVDHKIGWATSLFLFGVFLVLLSVAILLRKNDEGDQNGN